MNYEEAILLLHPDTTAEALAEIEYYGGFNGHEAMIRAVSEACILACEALEKRVPKKPKEKESPERTHYTCPNCDYIPLTIYADGYHLGNKPNYCERCGQDINWNEVE